MEEETIHSLIDFIEKKRYKSSRNNHEFHLDFSKTNTFYKPFHFTILSCIIEEYYLNKIKIRLLPAKGVLHNHLNNIRFYEYWNERFDRGRFTRTKIKSTLCLWKICETMIDSYTQYAQAYFENNFKHFEGKSLDQLGIALAEVFNNIFNHSKSLVDGYTITQLYSSQRKLEISVCDFGIGIPSSINNYWFKEKGRLLNDEDAIRASLIKKISAKSTPQNKGFGLNNLSSIVKSLNGKLTICSNFGLLIQYPKGLRYRKSISKKFPGTLIHIELDVNSFPEKEKELDNVDFDF